MNDGIDPSGLGGPIAAVTVCDPRLQRSKLGTYDRISPSVLSMRPRVEPVRGTVPRKVSNVDASIP